MPRALVMHRFRYRDPSTGRWMRARYRATLADIRARYAEWALEDHAEHRQVEAVAIGALAQPPVRREPGSHTALIEQAPKVDPLEAALLACFLRRYVTYCARRRRYAAMNGAARLLREIAAVAR